MKLNLVALAAVSLLALPGCTTTSVATTNLADSAAIDRAMPGNANTPFGAMQAPEANSVPVRLEP